jgi:prophage antirepressor-like protein
MKDIKIFNNSEFGELGVLVIEGKEMFPATECAKLLGYTDPYDAINRHTKGSVKHRVLTVGGEQEIKFKRGGSAWV